MTTTQNQSTDQDTTLVIRRGLSATRLLPVPPPSATTVVARRVLHPSETKKPETSRERQIAGDLPQWEPLPPDELFVHRRQ